MYTAAVKWKNVFCFCNSATLNLKRDGKKKVRAPLSRGGLIEGPLTFIVSSSLNNKTICQAYH